MDRRTLLTVAWRILCRAHRTEMALAVTLATSRPSMGRGPGDSGRAACVAPPHPWRVGPGLETGLRKGPGDLYRLASRCPCSLGLLKPPLSPAGTGGGWTCPGPLAQGGGVAEGLL